MSRAWIIVLVAGGLVVALVLGLVATSESRAERQLCDNLSTLGASVTNLTSLSPTTATQGEFQSSVGSVRSAWGNVKISAQKVTDANVDSITSAWNDFSQAVQSVPSSASVSDAEQSISQSADALESAVQSSIDSYDCSNS